MSTWDFYVEAPGKTAVEAFAIATNPAGRNGDPQFAAMSRKQSFVPIEDDWKTVKRRYVTALATLRDIISEVTETPPKDFNPELLWEMLNTIDVPVWNPSLNNAKSKNAALVALRDLASYWREKRDSCSRKMGPSEVAEALICDFNDTRVSEPDGPAGCIDLTPKVAGIRKRKNFLFFGVAPA